MLKIEIYAQKMGNKFKKKTYVIYQIQRVKYIFNILPCLQKVKLNNNESCDVSAGCRNIIYEKYINDNKTLLCFFSVTLYHRFYDLSITIKLGIQMLL